MRHIEEQSSATSYCLRTDGKDVAVLHHALCKVYITQSNAKAQIGFDAAKNLVKQLPEVAQKAGVFCPDCLVELYKKMDS